MGYELILPSDKGQREDVICNLVQTGEQARAVREVQWWFVHHYLNGARDFGSFNFERGALDVSYMNNNGLLQFRYEDIVAKYRAQLGRLLQMDLNPSVRRKNVGLEDMKNAALGQIALRAAFPPTEVRRLHLEALAPLTKYGCVGLAVWVSSDDIGLDVVLPWELVPLPPCPLEASEQRGIARVRWVPLNWVEQLPYVQGKHIPWSEMETIQIEVGQMPEGAEARFATFGGTVKDPDAGGSRAANAHLWGGKRGSRGERGTVQDQTKVDIVKFIEVWTWTEKGYVREYVVNAGKREIHWRNYANFRLPPPLQVANDIPTGGFYGRGFLETLIPMNTEIEFSAGRLFQNVQDFDVNGILCTPAQLQIPMEAIRGADGLKRLPYSVDYTVPDVKPFSLQPANAGTMPVEAIKMGVALGDKIANQPSELMGGDAPGRVDSQKGIGLLYELSNTPLTPTALSLSNAVSGCYAAALALLPTVWGPDKAVEVAILDDAMAGVQLDPATGTVTLNSGINALPHPDTVEVGVKSVMPRSKEAEKAELKDALARGAMDMVEYRIEARKRDLDLPVGGEAEWQNWRRAVMNNIIIWGDGQTPGEVDVNDHDMHDIHVRVITQFMARPEFYASGGAVRQKFTDVLLAHQALLAQFPEQLPYPEELTPEGTEAMPTAQGVA